MLVPHWPEVKFLWVQPGLSKHSFMCITKHTLYLVLSLFDGSLIFISKKTVVGFPKGLHVFVAFIQLLLYIRVKLDFKQTLNLKIRQLSTVCCKCWCNCCEEQSHSLYLMCALHCAHAWVTTLSWSTPLWASNELSLCSNKLDFAGQTCLVRQVNNQRILWT